MTDARVLWFIFNYLRLLGIRVRKTQIGFFRIAANEGATTGSGNHLRQPGFRISLRLQGFCRYDMAYHRVLPERWPWDTCRSSPCGRAAAVSLAVGKCLKVLLKGIHIRSHRDNPVGVKGVFDIFLFLTLFAHVGETEKLLAWTYRFNLMFSHHAILLRSAKWPTIIWKPHLLLLCCIRYKSSADWCPLPSKFEQWLPSENWTGVTKTLTGYRWE